MPLPVSYDERRNRWKTLGTFCSWACAKGFSSDDHNVYRAGMRGNLLLLLKKRTTGKLEGIVPAPPRRCLRVFGGNMTIDEFRAVSGAMIVVTQLPEKMVPMELIVHQRRIDAKHASEAPKPNLGQEVDFTPKAPGKNETLRLKRPKPSVKSSDALAKAMGLQIT